MRESVQILEKKIFIKRDDLLDFGITGFNGNKARKFLSLLDSQYEVFVSFGGNQSNAMQVLAALAKARGKEFFYITSEPPKFLRTSPMGNFAFGLAHNVRYVFAPAGSRVEVLENLAREVFAQQYKRYGERALFIPQGGSEELAMRGMRELVRELCEMRESLGTSGISNAPILKNLKSRSGFDVCSRSGVSGDSFPASDIQEHSSCNEIVVFISAGSGVSARSFVRAQCEMRRECENGQCESKNAGDMELITLCCAGEIGGVGRTLCADFAFGSLQAEVWAMYHKLLAQGIEFDLLYDCVGFVLLERALEQGYFSDEDLAKPWVFVHSGGLLGNASQILRYERKFGVSFLHAQKIPHKKNPL